jgi:predicted SnoaL-like aldol condensation-catalyzing enzyme
MTQKTIAETFLHMTARGESRKAFAAFVAENFIHHNAYFKGDAESLMLAMEENAKAFPGTEVNIQRIIEEKSLVAVHSHIRLSAKEPGLAIMHIFRFENGKIAELWDFGQPVPENIVNGNGMF